MLVESLVRCGSTDMRSSARAMLAGGVMLALCGAPTGAAAQIQVVSAGAEYQAFHPRRAAKAPPAAGDFQATMDEVFGQGRWRQTSGYRTQAQENALRRQGAGAVAPGRTSFHSVGSAEAPGAYDAVVERMSPAAAAARLKAAGVGFSRVLAEGAHGGQGPHLHIELTRNAASSGAGAGEN
jgi:hypothetical protein